MLSNRYDGVLVVSCSYCCGDLLIANGEEEACRFCGNPKNWLSPLLPHTAPNATSHLREDRIWSEREKQPVEPASRLNVRA
jgi:hypothetical protein